MKNISHELNSGKEFVEKNFPDLVDKEELSVNAKEISEKISLDKCKVCKTGGIKNCRHIANAFPVDKEEEKDFRGSTGALPEEPTCPHGAIENECPVIDCGNYKEEWWIKEFQEKYHWIFGSGINPLKQFISKVSTQAKEEEKEKIIDIITDEATGAGCLNKNFNCCGYHDACENILKRVNLIKDNE